MDKLKKLIKELLDHVDDHKDVYKNWTNEQISETWVNSHSHEFEPLLKDKH